MRDKDQTQIDVLQCKHPLSIYVGQNDPFFHQVSNISILRLGFKNWIFPATLKKNQIKNGRFSMNEFPESSKLQSSKKGNPTKMQFFWTLTS
jgi:hypothetical protein